MNGLEICNGSPEPARSDNNVAVVMSFSREYLPYSCVAIYSLLANSSSHYFYDIIILAYEPETFETEVFENLCAHYDNVSFRAVDIKAFDLSGAFVEGHLGYETYSRLLIPQILCNYRRAVYLDSDIAVCRDIAELYNSPIGADTMIAGVPDVDLIGQCFGADEAMKYYLRKKVRIERVERYIQAGVLVFNIEKLRSCYSDGMLTELARNSRLRYFDQDILNYACRDNIGLIDYRWNVVSDCDDIRISRIISRAPSDMLVKYMESRKDPWIIHYSGYIKPWEDPDIDMGERYWHIIDGTDLLQLSRPSDSIKKKKGIRQWLSGTLFPYGSKSRQIFKTIFLGIKYKQIKEMQSL